MSGEEQKLAVEYHLFRCVQCGKCTGGCPVSTRSALNVRHLVAQGLRLHTFQGIENREEIWECTTCSTCEDRCPKGVSCLELILKMRSFLVEKGRIQSSMRDALESTFKQGNPWGKAKQKRADWAKGLKVENIEKNKAEILYYVGCTPAYDPRVQKVAKALVQCLHRAEVEFGILGTEEKCCGSEIRRMGEEGLFEMLVEDNLNVFKKYPLRLIITTSPHCYNVLKNEYPNLNCQVQHYTQFVARLIDEGKLSFNRSWNGEELLVAYHDPCFLGKQNGVFEEPRKILQNIPGIKLVEFDRSKERSLCCGGGGGRIWTESKRSYERLAETRVKEAVELGVQVIATACPFCLLTLEDGVKTTGYENSLRVMDIMELVAEAL